MTIDDINSEVTKYLETEADVANRKKFWRNHLSAWIITKLQDVERETEFYRLNPKFSRINNFDVQVSVERQGDAFERRLSGKPVTNAMVFTETHAGDVAIHFFIVSPGQNKILHHKTIRPDIPEKMDYDSIVMEAIAAFIKALHREEEEGVNVFTD